ncbi:MAG: hypothetical protein GC182_15675 [Rhodopseudomonas sp.]|nr:hypothetical protein [Rhodopseudomonas sp.]
MPQSATTSGTAIERLRREIQRAFNNIRIELDRIEILTAAVQGFSSPIPHYEPEFHHQRRLTSAVRHLS